MGVRRIRVGRRGLPVVAREGTALTGREVPAVAGGIDLERLAVGAEPMPGRLEEVVVGPTCDWSKRQGGKGEREEEVVVSHVVLPGLGATDAVRRQDDHGRGEGSLDHAGE